MDWDNPADRAALIDRVGPKEYNRLFDQHREESAVARIGGRRIWPVKTQFGKLFHVEGTNSAFETQADAEKHAAENPVAQKDSE